MKLLRKLLFPTQQEMEIEMLRHRLATCEEQIEKIMDLVNNLATFDERFSRELLNLSSRMSLIESAITRGGSWRQASSRRASNDDDMIN